MLTLAGEAKEQILNESINSRIATPAPVLRTSLTRHLLNNLPYNFTEESVLFNRHFTVDGNAIETFSSTLQRHDASMKRPCTASARREELYRRRYYTAPYEQGDNSVVSECSVISDDDENDVNTLSKLRSRKRLRVTMPSQTLFSPEQPKSYVDFTTSVEMPLKTSLIRTFAKMSGFVDFDDIESYAAAPLTPSVLMLLRLLLFTPSQKQRAEAVAEYSSHFTEMADWLQTEVSRATYTSNALLPFSLSHSLLDLYSLLWYSPPVQHRQTNPSRREKQFKGQTKDIVFDTSKDDEHNLPSLPIAVMSETIDKVKVYLFLWYVKHGRSVPTALAVNQIFRTADIFDFQKIDSVPPVVFEETSNHLVRLLLLCNFNELFQVLYELQYLEDPVAALLVEGLLATEVAKNISAHRFNILNLSTHTKFLRTLRTSLKRVSSNFVDFGQKHIASSIFGKCVRLLLGSEEEIDQIIHQVFPKCWLASFILGLFWRCIDDPQVVSDMCNVLGDTVDEIGDIAIYFFNSWLDGHSSMQNYKNFKILEQPIAFMLANDIDELTDWLVDHSDYFISPILMDLLSWDHHFPFEERKCAEVYFRFAQSLLKFTSKDIELTTLFCYSRGFFEARRESSNRKLTMQTDVSKKKSNEGIIARQPRYGLPKHEIETLSNGIVTSKRKRDLNNNNDDIFTNNDDCCSIGETLNRLLKQDLSTVLTSDIQRVPFLFINQSTNNKQCAMSMALSSLILRFYEPQLDFKIFNIFAQLFDFLIVEESFPNLIELSEVLAHITEVLTKKLLNDNTIDEKKEKYNNNHPIEKRHLFTTTTDSLLFACRHTVILQSISKLQELQSEEGYTYPSQELELFKDYQEDLLLSLQAAIIEFQRKQTQNYSKIFEAGASWRFNITQIVSSSPSPPSPSTYETNTFNFDTEKLSETCRIKQQRRETLIDTVIQNVPCLHNESLYPDIQLERLLPELSCSAIYNKHLAYLVKLTQYWDIVQAVISYPSLVSSSSSFMEDEDKLTEKEEYKGIHNNVIIQKKLPIIQETDIRNYLNHMGDQYTEAARWMLKLLCTHCVPFSHWNLTLEFLYKCLQVSDTFTLDELQTLSTFWSKYKNGLWNFESVSTKSSSNNMICLESWLPKTRQGKLRCTNFLHAVTRAKMQTALSSHPLKDKSLLICSPNENVNNKGMTTTPTEKQKCLLDIWAERQLLF